MRSRREREDKKERQDGDSEGIDRRIRREMYRENRSREVEVRYRREV